MASEEEKRIAYVKGLEISLVEARAARMGAEEEAYKWEQMDGRTRGRAIKAEQELAALRKKHHEQHLQLENSVCSQEELVEMIESEVEPWREDFTKAAKLLQWMLDWAQNGETKDTMEVAERLTEARALLEKVPKETK